MDTTNHQPLAVIGVVADTHVPDRVRALPECVLAVLEQAGVSRILHAGDISTPAVLDRLAQVAPVTAVRGNRDFLIAGLPLATELDAAGVTIGLAHGHGGFTKYWRDKWLYITGGYQFERYQAYLAKLFPEVNVVVFGHSHRVENRLIDGKLFFNPGSVYACRENGNAYRLGLIRVYAGGQVEAESVTCGELSAP